MSDKSCCDQANIKACCSSLAALLPPKLFKALSDPKRLSLFVRLAVNHAPATVGQLAKGSGVDLSVVSRHLSVLRDAGLIKCDKRGKEVWCAVEIKAVAQMLRNIAGALETCCPGTPAPANAKTSKRHSKT